MDEFEGLSDEELMHRYATKGDLRAFECLVLRHEHALLNFAYRALGDEALAREVLQETFIAMVRGAARYEPTARLTTWMYTIARNQCVDRLRRRRPTVSLDEVRGPDDSQPLVARLADDTALHGDDEIQMQRFQRALAAALERLPPEQREVFMLREATGLKFDEIAALHGIAPGTAKSRMRLAIAQLRRDLADFAPDGALPDPEAV